MTRVDDPGASDPADLARAWRAVTGRSAYTAAGPEDALEMAAAMDGDRIVVAGSLYLVGAVRGILTGTSEEG